MSVATVSTLVCGTDANEVAQRTLEQLEHKLGELGQRVRAGLVYSTQLDPEVLRRALVAGLPDVPLLGSTVEGALGVDGVFERGPAVAAWWLVGDGFAVGVGANQDSALKHGGIQSFKARFAIVHGRAAPQLSYVLPRAAALLAADVGEVWTHAGPAALAVMISDWPALLAAGFDDPKTELERKGMAPASVVGSLLLTTGAAHAQIPSPCVVAAARAIRGVPGEGDETRPCKVLLLSSVTLLGES